MKKGLALTLLIIGFTLSANAQFMAIDPSERCLNARVIGLGRSFVGLADDASAIYLNPAGLAKHKNWEVTTLSGKLLEDYNYLSLSGVYPSPYGNFGIGFGGYSIAGAYATKVVDGSDPNDPIYEIDFSQPQIQNSNYVFNLAYANRLSNLYKGFSWADKVSLGASAKFFRVGLSGDLITQGDASGLQLDLGLLYDVNPMLTLGAAFQNALPGALGGTLTYASGHKEGFPHILRIGGALKLLGSKNALFRINQEVMLMADVEYQVLTTNTLPIYRVGLEWKPIDIIAIRTGIDQSVEGDGTGQKLQTVNNFASGVGVKYGGFRFDYGYHSFVTMTGVANHFFSLSYGLAAPVVEVKEKLVLDEPADKLITFANKTTVSGNVLDPNAKSLKIKDQPAKFGLKGEFETEVDLALGKNKIDAAIYDGSGKLLASKFARVLRLIAFPDVAQSYWVAQPISLLAMQKIITGYPDGTFRPDGNITRAEMCALLIKSKIQTSNIKIKENLFKDVPAKHWAASYIAQAAEEGVVKGYPDGTFRPSGKITRAEGLAMIARFAGISEEVYANEFSDLSSSHWAAKIVAGAYKLGVLEYLKGKPFEASKLLTRAETVEMLYRTQVVKDILAKDLLNWETY